MGRLISQIKEMMANTAGDSRAMISAVWKPLDKTGQANAPMMSNGYKIPTTVDKRGCEGCLTERNICPHSNDVKAHNSQTIKPYVHEFPQ